MARRPIEPFAAWGVGATAGAFGAGFIKIPRRFGWLIVAFCAWIGLGIVVVGVLPTLLPAALAMGVTGIATGVINTYGISWLQRRTDPAMHVAGDDGVHGAHAGVVRSLGRDRGRQPDAALRGCGRNDPRVRRRRRREPLRPLFALDAGRTITAIGATFPKGGL